MDDASTVSAGFFAHPRVSGHSGPPSTGCPRKKASMSPLSRKARSPRRAASFLAGALAVAALLHAQPASADARTEARRHFKRGMELVAKKNFDEGIKELEKAYEL